MDNDIINTLWILISATLILLMQAGFLCLESGITRTKNSINVAMKNVADFILSFFTFWMVGFGLMFGSTSEGFWGTDSFFKEIGQGSSWEAAFFIFQTMFCATAATIVSGSIAERVHFHAYLIITLIIVGLIYPVSGHWAWGSALLEQNALLFDIGFIDFAGSTVVHSVGGWVALAALIIIGPRTGRFNDGKIIAIPGSNPTLSLLGALLIVVGWIGFNGGSTLELNHSVAGIIANTLLSAASGGMTGYLLLLLFRKKVTDQLLMPINGTLAGLVAITANAHAVTALDSVFIGSIGALVMFVIDNWMLRKKIDDAIGAIPVHLGAGVWGTLAVALFGDPVILDTGLSMKDQMIAQVLGITTIGLWAFTVSFLLLYIFNKFFPLRVNPDDEKVGLNVSEHGAKNDLMILLTSMKEQEQSRDLRKRVLVEPFTEVGQIAFQYNKVIDALEKAIDQTQSIIRDIKDGILTVDLNGLITSFNPGAEIIFDLPANEAIGKPFTSLIHPEEPSLFKINKQEDPQKQISIINKNKFLIGARPDKKRLNMEVAFFESTSSKSKQFTASIRDITEKKRIEDQLFQEKERALVTLESIVDGVITTDSYGIIEYLNPSAEYFTGHSFNEAVGKKFEFVYQVIDEQTGAKLNDVLKNPLTKKQPSFDSSTYTLTSVDGSKFSVQHTSAPILDANKSILGSVTVFHDVTITREMQKQLSHQATHDSLTGLMNRTAFENDAAELIAHVGYSDEEEHVLCYLDLDQFKIVNDTCGHVAGDELLKQVSHLIKTKLRVGDAFARLGGDEFGLILHACPLERGVSICEEILESIRNFRFPWEENQFSIGVSIGLVSIKSHTESLSKVLSQADAACYAAKDLGRNRVHVYEPDDIELANRQGQMQWVSKIRQALDRDDFRLYYQTISPLNQENQIGAHYEIFIRMIDENNNIIPPGSFIPAAERYNLMQEIDLWIIKNSLAWLSDYSKNNSNRIGLCGLNLSGASVGDTTCLELIKKFLKDYQVNPNFICFEITETAAIANLRAATEFIDDLSQIGCKFALDDFGSGLSSFGYLKNLKVDYLKIDGSFIKNIDKDSTDEAMVRSINNIGHVMGLETIAEFVESEEIVTKLREIGVDYAQGYYIDKPRPLEQLEGVRFMPR